MIVLELLVFVLLDPLKSAEPPINCGNNCETASIVTAEHCLVAKLGLDSKYFFFSLYIKFSNSTISKLFVNFSNSFFIATLFLFKSLLHFFSNSLPFFPISFHSFKISSGKTKGSYFHFNFFLTSAISSSPNGDP